MEAVPAVFPAVDSDRAAFPVPAASEAALRSLPDLLVVDHSAVQEPPAPSPAAEAEDRITTATTIIDRGIEVIITVVTIPGITAEGGGTDTTTDHGTTAPAIGSAAQYF